jgi:spermidine/putrescine transport system substrate-binding protein
MKLLIRSFFILLMTIALLSSTYFVSQTFTSAKSKTTLNIFVWGDMFPEEVFKQFEKETGIHLVTNFYTSNEELIVKLENSKGSDYDLVFPSDYGVISLIEKGLLKPLDKSKLQFLDRIEPYLMNQAFDMSNIYSIPYNWEVYGITEELTKACNSFTPSLSLLFEGTRKIVMTDDPVEAIDFAAHYLYGYKKSLKPHEEYEVIKLLKHQKQRVEAYTDNRVQYMITSNKDCPTALMRVSFFWKHYNELSHLQIHLPKEGVFTTIETVAISANSKNLDAAYKFINYIYKPEIMAASLFESPLFPACKDALPLTPFVEIPRYQELFEEIKSRDDLYFTHYLIPKERYRPAWVEIKS